MNYIRTDWMANPFPCYSDTPRPLKVGNFVVQQQVWSRSRVDASRIECSTPIIGGIPSFESDWKLIRGEALPMYAAFPQVCDESPFLEHVHCRTSCLVPEVTSMYGYWTGLYSLRMWRHLVPLDEQQDPDHVRHVALICVALDGLMTAMQIADDMVDGTVKRYGRPAWHLTATQTLACDVIQLNNMIVHVLQHICKQHPFRAELIEEATTFLSWQSWIVSRDASREPFQWNGERQRMFNLDGWYAVQKIRACPQPMLGFILHLAGYGNHRLIGRITQSAYFILSVYCALNDVIDTFGDPLRPGEDIKNGSASLTICATLHYIKENLAHREPTRAAALLQILEENYGKGDDAEAVKRVVAVFQECGTKELAIREINGMLDEFVATMNRTGSDDYPIWVELEAYLHLDCAAQVSYTRDLDDGWVEAKLHKLGIIPGKSSHEEIIACMRELNNKVC